MGSLKGQDVGKIFIMMTILYGCFVEIAIRLFQIPSVFSLSNIFFLEGAEMKREIPMIITFVVCALLFATTYLM